MLVAIPVFERERTVRHALSTVAEMLLPHGTDILVLDDASMSFDVLGATVSAGLVCEYVRMPRRLGADDMIRHIWERFLAGQHHELLFFDSDMIANTNAAIDGLNLLHRNGGLLSLYNSTNHPGNRFGDGLLRKTVVGNAGTLWTRGLAELALQSTLDVAHGVDHAYCRVFSERDISILVTERSLLQHIGIYGTNNSQFGQLEHGAGFSPDGLAQWRAINFVYDDLMTRQKEFLAERAGRMQQVMRFFDPRCYR